MAARKTSYVEKIVVICLIKTYHSRDEVGWSYVLTGSIQTKQTPLIDFKYKEGVAASVIQLLSDDLYAWDDYQVVSAIPEDARELRGLIDRYFKL